MQNATLWCALLGVEKRVVEGIEFDHHEQLWSLMPGLEKRPWSVPAMSASLVWLRRPGRAKRWRTLDLGMIQAVLEADAPLVRCPEHGPTVAAVPWARHAAGHTSVSDEQVAWLVTQCPKSAVTELTRLA